MKPMDTICDLIEEAKVRTVWWALFIFAITYFLTHTSKSMWMNIPISILFVSALRILLNKVEFRWKVKPPASQTYLSHLEKKQLSLNDSRLSTPPPPAKWKRKIDSPVVEAAVNDFIEKILKDFVTDLWYADITPDREFPRHIHAIIMDALGEISGRLKEINLVDLLSRDIIDLVGDHLDLFRRNQAAIGVDVMLTLSSEERDERLKYHLLNSKELHPALISPESEYKVLQRLMGGVLAIVLRQREAQCPVIRSIARELLTCLVMQPIMDLASPGYINELIESLLLVINDCGTVGAASDQSSNAASQHHGHSVVAGGGHVDKTALKKPPSLNQQADMTLAKMHYQQDRLQVKHADWARMLDAATQKRTEVLMPENLENMWTKGRNYKKKENKKLKASTQDLSAKSPATDSVVPVRNLTNEKSASNPGKYANQDDKCLQAMPSLNPDPLINVQSTNKLQSFQNPDKELFEGEHQVDAVKDTEVLSHKSRLKRSNSTSDLGIQPQKEGGPIISEGATISQASLSGMHLVCDSYEIYYFGEYRVYYMKKIIALVMGAYFEKLGSKSFAVYSIAVTDALNKTWFVKRRYRNFERLHRHLKDIPNYTLHLPPKRIFSSSTEDAFVHQRCIQLDKYLQDLLSIANVAEQHEVWDFLSVSSKNYSFGKSSSMMKTLAVNVDDAVDDIVRQFKGVSDGLMRKVVGSTSPTNEGSSTSTTWNLSWNSDELDKSIPRQNMAETVSKGYPPQEINHAEEIQLLCHLSCQLEIKLVPRCLRAALEINSTISMLVMEDAIDDWLLRQINLLRQEETIAQGIRLKPIRSFLKQNFNLPVLNFLYMILQRTQTGLLNIYLLKISFPLLYLLVQDAKSNCALQQIPWYQESRTLRVILRWLIHIETSNGYFIRYKVRADGKKGDLINLWPEDGKFCTFSGEAEAANMGYKHHLSTLMKASSLKHLELCGTIVAIIVILGYLKKKRKCVCVYLILSSTVQARQLTSEFLQNCLVLCFLEIVDLVKVHQEKTIGIDRIMHFGSS
ncbi:Sorting nexin-16 [Senna tora]|uniref:Sorting nexin-16 n=1 Tax=Senna tora TaxID=362788 RepID=A0A834SWK5_9FABA|nr:Sorting nexin-16 [Senna tora]